VERLRKTEALLVKVETGLLVVLLSTMVCLSFLQVVLRYAGKGLLWADTLSRYLVLWVGFLGAALAAAGSKHFAWEAAAQREDKAGHIMHLVAHLAAVVLSAFLARASWAYLLTDKADAQTLFTIGTTQFPEWAFVVAVPLGFVLVMLHSLIKLAEAAEHLRRA
jgi:TRAP-type C4-dicarboxylate transport system permease small subunit